MIPVTPFLDYNRTFCLKGLCMIMIIFHHCYTHGIWFEFYLFDRLLQPVQWGYLGTGCFFFLSGFGLFVSCSKKFKFTPMPIEWFWSKMQKLLIPFIAAFIVAIIVLQIYPPSTRLLLKEWIVSFCTLTIPPTTTWFLKVIVGLYILTFLAFRLVKSDSEKVLFILIPCVFYFLIMSCSGQGDWWWTTVLNFPMGVIFAYRDTYKIVSPKSFTIFLCLIAIILWPAMGKLYVVIGYYSWVLMSLIFSLAACSIIQYVPIENSLFRYVGHNSINFYLFQMPLLYLSRHFSSIPIRFLIVLGGAFFLSYVYSIIEMKFKTLKK